MYMIQLRIESARKRYHDWLTELDKLHCIVCDPRLGYIDIPVYSKSMNNVICLCINSKSIANTVTWHRLDEGYNECRPFEWALDEEIPTR